MPPTTHLERLWDTGQRLLAAGRYVAARSALEAAESLAWRRRNAVALARIHLPLLETRRQIRYLAADGVILICNPAGLARDENALLKPFLACDAGTVLLTCAAGEGEAACRFTGSVNFASRRSGKSLESLVLIRLAADVRLAPQSDPVFSAGLPVIWTRTRQNLLPSEDPQFQAFLPPPGRYTAADPSHPIARETLLLGWEALALKWQRRHPPPHPTDPWTEIAWLRLALRTDPACEPIAMRILSLAESLSRR